MTDFNAGDDIINVRDIVDRVEELRSERDDLVQVMDEMIDGYNAQDSDDNTITSEEIEAAKKDFADWKEENFDELETLESLLSDLCGYGGDEQWEGAWYPSTLIHENHFEASMDELLEDIGDIPKDLPSHLTITVDYDALKQDYSEVEFDGETYYYR